MFSRPKILFLVSLLFVVLLNPKFNPYLLFKFLIFYHSSYYYDLITEAQTGLEEYPRTLEQAWPFVILLGPIS